MKKRRIGFDSDGSFNDDDFDICDEYKDIKIRDVFYGILLILVIVFLPIIVLLIIFGSEYKRRRKEKKVETYNIVKIKDKNTEEDTEYTGDIEIYTPKE